MTTLISILVLSLSMGQASPRHEAPVSFELTMQGERVQHARAVDAPIALIAKRLSEALKVPVKVAPEHARDLVTFSVLKNVSVTEVLSRVSSSSLVDTEERWGGSSRLVGVLLGGNIANAPKDDELQTSGVMVEGHTDEELVGEGEEPQTPRADKPAPSPSATPEEPAGPFLRVSKEEGGRISVRAREQGLGTILFQIAQAYGVRFDMRVSEAALVPELSIPAALPSDLPGILGPGAGLVVRRNLATGEERPLRFFLEPPENEF